MDAKIVDITDILANRTAPEDRVPVFVEEDVMVEFSKVCRKADLGDEESAKKRDEIIEKMAELVLWVSLRKPPRKVTRGIAAAIQKEFPPKYSALGIPLPNLEAEEEQEVRTWAAHIVAIDTPQGSIPVTTETIRVIRDEFPVASLDAIAVAINNMTEGSKAGYDLAVQEIGFLSQPSPEE